ncbi:anti-sigma B factor RsbW [Paenibacillus aquistagni]|uniref:Serine/threonine-protein kinase RsbW n=1 Tax=Paenibacillus aquistagni TaxID=1852522 RepID=A0A1X7LPV8_9BACL|nr:anti-sigma B factor RsbW [Paenibacillus aquistagni]NMM53236.1 anti-sigma B factor RsbW [Paenibacillus aquistagni]SMG55921.1 serine/threonine-protein kinase RsbW [Paenibacillus aquistagni]
MADVNLQQQVRLSIPAQAEYVDLVRLTLYGIAHQMGFSFEDIEDMKVAVSEACNNAVLYAYKRDGGIVDIVFNVGDQELELVIRDEGESFDAEEKTQEPGAWHDTPLEDVETGGLGFYLMQALMDDLEVNSMEGRGTEVRMKKSITFSEEHQ